MIEWHAHMRWGEAIDCVRLIGNALGSSLNSSAHISLYHSVLGFFVDLSNPNFLYPLTHSPGDNPLVINGGERRSFNLIFYIPQRSVRWTCGLRHGDAVTTFRLHKRTNKLIDIDGDEHFYVLLVSSRSIPPLSECGARNKNAYVSLGDCPLDNSERGVNMIVGALMIVVQYSP